MTCGCVCVGSDAYANVFADVALAVVGAVADAGPVVADVYVVVADVADAAAAAIIVVVGVGC